MPLTCIDGAATMCLALYSAAPDGTAVFLAGTSHAEVQLQQQVQ